jgi:hypothetical protein
MAVAQTYKYIDSEVAKWIDIHFGDTSFNGRAFIGRRKKDTVGVFNHLRCTLTSIKSKLAEMDVSPDYDYYITANTVHGIKRRQEDLFGLQNIVLDVDCHEDGYTLQYIKDLCQRFIRRFKRDLWDTGVIPTPNSIVLTGRGMQFWWAIKPCYGGKGYHKSLYFHRIIKRNLMGHVKQLLGEYEEELDGLTLDGGASNNLVGYFRLPHTTHTATNSRVGLMLLHDTRYDQRELIKMDRPERSEMVVSSADNPRKTKHIALQETDRRTLQGFESLGSRRVLQLVKLRNLRNNKVGSEMRDHFNFSVYNSLRMSLDHEPAMVRLREYNQGFKDPMTEEELENTVWAAKAKGGYWYSNDKLIDFLDITPEEQYSIGLFPNVKRRKSKSNASRDTIRHALREDRDQKIIEYTEKGISQAETARLLGIGKNTVYRVLKRLRDAVKVEVVEHFPAPKTKQNDRHHFGALYGLLLPAVPTKPRSLEGAVVGLQEGALFGMPEKDSS